MIFMVLGFQDSLLVEVFMVCELERYKSTKHVTRFFLKKIWGQLKVCLIQYIAMIFLKNFLIQFLMFVAWFSWHVCLFSKVYEVIHCWGSIRSV